MGLTGMSSTSDVLRAKDGTTDKQWLDEAKRQNHRAWSLCLDCVFVKPGR